MEKRRYTRTAINNFSVDVSDGFGFFSGIISDFSRYGLCMTDLPKKMNRDVKKMTVIVSGQGKRFKMNVMPKWLSNKDNFSNSVGAEILDAPRNWTEFAMKFEPKSQQDKCVWDSVRI